MHRTTKYARAVVGAALVAGGTFLLLRPTPDASHATTPPHRTICIEHTFDSRAWRVSIAPTDDANAVAADAGAVVVADAVCATATPFTDEPTGPLCVAVFGDVTTTRAPRSIFVGDLDYATSLYAPVYDASWATVADADALVLADGYVVAPNELCARFAAGRR